MKKFGLLLLASVLGGIIAITSYLYLSKEKQETVFANNKTEQSPFIYTSNNGNNAYSPESSIDFTKAAQETVDAVVHVKNKTIQTVRDPFAEMYYGRDHGTKKYEQIGTGSGVIISNDGFIITNNHVVKGATELEITLNNRKTYKAKLIGADSKSDIALVKIEEKGLPFLTFANSDNLKIGEWVLAVGNPFNLTSTVTAGIVSAKARDLDGNKTNDSFIQTDAAVNPGNSGGALVNTNGELVGINTAIASRTGSYVGYSFAVPSNIAKKIIEDLLEYGNVQRAILGVHGGELNGAIAEDLNISNTEGFYVSKVIEDSGAALAGIRKDDIIVQLDKIKIKSFSDLAGYLNSKQPGDQIEVKIIRNNTVKNIVVILTKDDELKEIELGFKLRNLSVKELNKRNLKNGVLISEIENIELKRYGVKEGFIIINVNGVVVENALEIETIISKKLDNEPIRIEMLNLNGERERYIFR